MLLAVFGVSYFCRADWATLGKIIQQRANSDRAVQRRAAADVEANLRALGQGAEAAAGFDREKWSASLSPLLTLWQRLASTVEKVRSVTSMRRRPKSSHLSCVQSTRV